MLSFLIVSARVLTFGNDRAHLQIAGRQPDDRGLVQLIGDGVRQGQKFGQFEEFGVLFLSTAARRILGLLLHGFDSKVKAKSEDELHAVRIINHQSLAPVRENKKTNREVDEKQKGVRRIR